MPRHPPAIGELVIALALVGACSSATPSTSSPAVPTGGSPSSSGEPPPSVAASRSPVPSPSPALRLPIEKFRALVDSLDWSLAGDISGNLLTSWAGNDVYVNPVQGDIEVSMGDAHMLIAATDPTGIRVFEEARLDGKRSVRGPDGMWRPETAGPGARDLLSALLDPGVVKDAGTEEVDGRSLTVLDAGPVNVGSLNGFRPDQAGPTAAMTVLVDEDGKPVRVRLTFEKPSAAVPAMEQLEVAVTSVGDPFDITAGEAWQRHASGRGYSLLLPAWCDKLEGDDNWEQWNCGGSFYQRIWSIAAPDPLDEWVKGSVASWTGANGVAPAYLYQTLVVGTGPARVPAWLAIYRFDQDGVPVVMYDAVFVQGGKGMDVVTLGPADGEATIGALFLQILATMEFPS